MNSIKKTIANEEGSVLLVALFMLFAVTMLGFFSNNSSVIETQVSANNAFYKKSFYAAEAGLEHAQILLQNQLLESPENKNLPPNVFPKWSFALTDLGSDPVPGDPGPDNATVRLQNQTIGDCTYTVTVYDDWDPEEGSTQIVNIDSNSLVYVRSEATGPNGARATVEMILEGVVTEREISDYTLQSGAGAGKASEGGDRNAVKDFTTRAANVGT